MFWEKGYETTSMQDLVSRMGVNRASLYATFGNKEILYKTALQNYSGHTLAQMKETIEQPGSPLTNLISYFKIMGSSKEMVNQHGCFLNNTAVELGPRSPEIATLVRVQWQKVEGIFKSALDKAIDQGELNPDTDTTALAQLSNTLLSGITVHSKVNRPLEEIGAVVKTAFTLLQAQRC